MLTACVLFTALLILSHVLLAQWHRAQAVLCVRRTLQATIDQYFAQHYEEDSIEASALLQSLDKEWWRLTTSRY